MKVDFIDLRLQYLAIQNEIDTALKSVMTDCAFSAGKYVNAFEENFARAVGAKYCVGVNSGTSALHSALLGLGIGLGDEVIVPTNTFFATPEAVSLTGAVPVFVDCEPVYYGIDYKAIEDKISSKTKAIIPVHLYGESAELAPIVDIAKKNDLHLIEDCSQSHLTKYGEKTVGTFGIMGCFSFYPGKNLGAYGEAGAVVTNDDQLYLKLMAMRDHGSYEKYHHDFVGHNYRMEGFQGAVLNVKLPYLKKWTDMRQQNAAIYRKHLNGIGEITPPSARKSDTHVYHLYSVLAKNRNKLRQYLLDNSIATGIHYPIPCHLQKAYSHLAYQCGSFSCSETIADEQLSLPMYPELTENQIEYICATIKNFYQSN
ncbi:MAG: DegT/DnrJ/EryC1/StrS family aminotransferase [Oligoflexia bacterium]|nr:DegT/DnrJ/EryC1/StrS family aminotransferase [Oligoflexia bacterium]